MTKTTARLISVVVPVLDEQGTIAQLASELQSTAQSSGLQLDAIFVDDGSSDGSWAIIRELAASPGIRGIRFRRNFGKAAALAAGFEAARADTVFQMDADLQDDPSEIPKFLARLDAGWDLVNGSRRRRRDPWHKTWPSRVFNWMIARATGLRLHDHNCGFKCARAEVVGELPLYGDMHRFIPALAHARGYLVSEVDVEHHPRRSGRSKYGVGRFSRGLLDLVTVVFLTRFGQRPLHLFGLAALGAILLGCAGLFYVLTSRVLAGTYGHAVLLVCSVGAMLFGIHLFATGLLAELLVSFNVQALARYSVAETAGHEPGSDQTRRAIDRGYCSDRT